MPQPKAHKYNRKQRLMKAKDWIKNYNGKKLHIGYAKHFGVSKLCAVTELELAGIIIPPDVKEALNRAEEYKRIERERLKRKKEKEKEKENQYINIEQDDYFAYIAGYTPGGAPYGITWEEMEAIEENERLGADVIVDILNDEGDYDEHYEDCLNCMDRENCKSDENSNTEEIDLPF